MRRVVATPASACQGYSPGEYTGLTRHRKDATLRQLSCKHTRPVAGEDWPLLCATARAPSLSLRRIPHRSSVGGGGSAPYASDADWSGFYWLRGIPSPRPEIWLADRGCGRC